MAHAELQGKAPVASGNRSGEGSARTAFEYHVKAITEREFLRFQELIYAEAGIWLSHAKIALLVGRLSKRLRQLELKSFGEYYQAVCDSPEERVQMLDAISTNETHFFREPRHFELLETSVFPQWEAAGAAGRRNRKIRVWSAGCSTGQEPYSLAMMLLGRFPPSAGWEIEIQATDLSTRVLDAAKAGVWSADKNKEIPSKYLKTFMLKGVGAQEGKMKAGPEIRSLIHFSRLNLNDPSYPLTGPFDLIFCRNVLIYFDMESRERIVRRLLSYLSPDGYLFIGHAESLHTMGDVICSVIPTVYRLIGKPGRENHGGK